MRQAFIKELVNTIMTLSMHDIRSSLDSSGVSYQTFNIPCSIDITEVFTEGDEGGELLLDFLTHELNFSRSAPPELLAQVLEFLRQLGEETDGKVFSDNCYELIVVDRLD